MKTCYYCGPTLEELRPYGPGGAEICFDCMVARPEREAEAKVHLAALLEACGPVVVIGGESGPRPLGKGKH